MKADNRSDKRAPKGGDGLWQDFGGKKNLAYGNGRTEVSDPVTDPSELN